MFNLISNSIKYTGKKEKAIIEIGGYLENNETIFFIKDNGAGFNMKYSDKLFTAFQRLHSQIEFEGTGLGLSISYDIIVKGHNGNIQLDSKPGEYTEFIITLPLK